MPGHPYDGEQVNRIARPGSTTIPAPPTPERVNSNMINEEMHKAMQEDLKEFADKLGENGETLEDAVRTAGLDLDAKERADLTAAYQKAGLDLNGLLFRAARKDVIAGKVKDRYINWSDVTLMNEIVLGQGGFGRVVLGEHDGSKVAVKLLIDKGLPTEKMKRDLEREVYIACNLIHRNVARVYGLCAAQLSPQRPYALVMEYYPK